MSILQAKRLALQSGSDQLENEQTAPRACNLAGHASRSLSQVDCDLQNRKGPVAPGPWCFAAFSQRADSLDGCALELGRRRNPVGTQQGDRLFAP